MKSSKRLRLGPLPGGGHKYVGSLERCLRFVQESNPSKEQLKEWFSKTFSKSEKTVNDYYNTIQSLHLIVESNGLLLSDLAKSFLETHDNILLYRKLDENYLGLHDILQLLYEKSLKTNDILPLMNKRIGTKWRTASQCLVRLNWFQSMGYVSKIDRKYTLIDEGREIVEKISRVRIPSHEEIKEIVVNLGRYSRYQFIEKEYRLNKDRIDVVWKAVENGDPSMAFEISLKGNLHQAILKLSRARNKWNSETFLIIYPEEKAEVDKLVKESLIEMRKPIRIMTFEDLFELYDSVKQAANKAKEYNITLLLMRKASLIGEIRRKRKKTNSDWK